VNPTTDRTDVMLLAVASRVQDPTTDCSLVCYVLDVEAFLAQAALVCLNQLTALVFTIQHHALIPLLLREHCMSCMTSKAKSSQYTNRPIVVEAVVAQLLPYNCVYICVAHNFAQHKTVVLVRTYMLSYACEHSSTLKEKGLRRINWNVFV
jgi:hypothetical protein